MFSGRRFVSFSLLSGIISLSVVSSYPISASAATAGCTGTADIYGVQSDNSLTFSTVDAASGKFTGVVNSGGYRLSFTPRAIATLNYNTILAVSTNNQLWRIDIKSVSDHLAVAGATLVGGSGWTESLIAYDGSGNLYGIAGNTLLRYEISGSKPSTFTGPLTIGSGFTLQTLTSPAPGWIMGTTADGQLLSYQINGTNDWSRYELRGTTWNFDTLTSAGGGFFLAKKGQALDSYENSDPTGGSGDTIGPQNTVTTEGWTQSKISAAPASVTCSTGAGESEWGVDTTWAVTQSNINVVSNSYGKPDFWGRYINGTAATNLSSTEVSLLHRNSINLLPIADQNNKFAVGSSAGRSAASSAIATAKKDGIPTGTAIYDDIEVGATIDAAYVEGWYSGFSGSGYIPAFYCNPVSGEFSTAYAAAISAVPDIGVKTLLWVNVPELYSYSNNKDKAPTWAPDAPKATAHVSLWQFKEEVPTSFDTIDLDESSPSISPHFG